MRTRLDRCCLLMMILKLDESLMGQRARLERCYLWTKCMRTRLEGCYLMMMILKWDECMMARELGSNGAVSGLIF